VRRRDFISSMLVAAVLWPEFLRAQFVDMITGVSGGSYRVNTRVVSAMVS
jgi:hypothetical protein